MELVTGKAGTPHVSSADDGRRIAGEVGTGSYVLQTGGRLAPSLVDANTVRFATGDMIVQGRHIGLTAPEDVKVASGTQGKKRTDYICVHYKRDVAGSNPTLVETCEWKVLRGTPGTKATAPAVPAGSILDGDAEATVPVASVDFDGLTTGKPKLLIPVLTPLATLGDSVSQSGEQPFAGGYLYSFGPMYVLQIQNMTIQAGVVRNVGKLPVKPTREVVGAISYGSSAGYVSVHADGTVYCTSKASGDFSGQVCFVA
jgi:hypothetical protein